MNYGTVSNNKTPPIVRDWSKFNPDSFVSDYAKIKWNLKFKDSENVDKSFEIFHTIMADLVDQHVPLVRLTRKQFKLTLKPWITKGILKSIINS